MKKRSRISQGSCGSLKVLEFGFLKAVTKQVITITRCVSWALMPQKCVSSRGSAPDPAGGAYSAPPDPLGGFEGAASLAYAYKSVGLL